MYKDSDSQGVQRTTMMQSVYVTLWHALQVEIMAKQGMQAPVEIQVGGRSVVNKDITQYVEIRQPEERFMRLLEILGNWQEQGKVLVFVNSQEQCDKLFRDLLTVGYWSILLASTQDSSLAACAVTMARMHNFDTQKQACS